MKTIYKITIIGILLALTFLTFDAAAYVRYEPILIPVCDCGCDPDFGCGCSFFCPNECICHAWFYFYDTSLQRDFYF